MPVPNNANLHTIYPPPPHLRAVLYSMQICGTVQFASGNKYTIRSVSADCKKLHRHIWFSEKTSTLKTPAAVMFDDDGDTVPADGTDTDTDADTVVVMVLPIRDTTMTIHCKKKLALHKHYTFYVTYRWYSAANKHVCLLIATI